MIISTIIITTIFITIAMLALAAIFDFCKMQIDNYIPVTILCCFIVAYAIDIVVFDHMQLFGNWWSPIVAAIIAFVITFIMFAIGMIGGGDSKLIAAIAPWLGLKGLIAFIFYMSIAGGILALLAVMLKEKKFLEPIAQKLGDKSWPAVLLSKKNALPYGIAILVGAIGAFWYIDMPQNIINQIYTNN